MAGASNRYSNQYKAPVIGGFSAVKIFDGLSSGLFNGPMATMSLFPSTISVTPVKMTGVSINKYNRDLLAEAYKIREIDQKGQAWSKKNYLGGYTSYSSYSELHQFSSTFDDLRKAIDPLVKDFAKTLEMDLQKKKLIMTSLWLNIMPKGTVHSMHIHPLSTISGTYYVQVPKNSSSLKFEDPRMVNFMASPPRKTKAREENQRFVSVAPKAGQVILFESWMRHEVPPNPVAQDRVSVSFNYDWI